MGRFESPLQVVGLFLMATCVSVGLLFFLNAEAESRIEHDGENTLRPPLPLLADPEKPNNSSSANASIIKYFEDEVYRIFQKFKKFKPDFTTVADADHQQEQADDDLNKLEQQKDIKSQIRQLWDSLIGAEEPSPKILQRFRRATIYNYEHPSSKQQNMILGLENDNLSKDSHDQNFNKNYKKSSHNQPSPDFHRIRHGHAMKKLGSGGLDLSIQRMIFDPNPGSIERTRPRPPPPPQFHHQLHPAEPQILPTKAKAKEKEKPKEIHQELAQEYQNNQNKFNFGQENEQNHKKITQNPMSSHRLSLSQTHGGDHNNHQKIIDSLPQITYSDSDSDEEDDDDDEDLDESNEDFDEFTTTTSSTTTPSTTEKTPTRHIPNTYYEAKKQLNMYYDEYNDEDEDEMNEDRFENEGRPIRRRNNEVDQSVEIPPHKNTYIIWDKEADERDNEDRDEDIFTKSTTTMRSSISIQSLGNESLFELTQRTKLLKEHLEICYKTDDVLIIIGITCCLNFAFCFLLWGCVRWFSFPAGTSKDNKDFQHLDCEEGGDSFLYHSPENEDWTSSSNGRKMRDSSSAYNFKRPEFVPQPLMRRSLSHSMENLKYAYA